MNQLLTVAELASRSGTSRAAWRKWIAERRVPVVKVGRCVRVRESDFEQFLRRNTRPALRPTHAEPAGGGDEAA